MKFKNRDDAQRAKDSNLARARKIAAEADAEGRHLQRSERLEIDSCMMSAKDAHIQVKEFDGDAQLLASLNVLSGPGRPGRTKGGGRGDGSWAKAMDTFLGRIGQKTLTPSGQITVPSLSSGIIATEDRPRSVLNLINFVGVDGTDTFSYLRETVRTQQASTVRPGQIKPTSVFSIEKIEDHVRTIAHLSEPVDRNTIKDVELLQAYLEGALREGVLLELEDQVLNGDASTAGVLDNMRGVLETSGIQSQPWDTDMLVTARKAVTQLEDLNLDPKGFAWAISPGDWERLELYRDSNGAFYFSGPGAGQAPPVDRGNKRLWGYPVTTTTTMPDGTGLLGDWKGSIVVREREDVEITWSEAVTIDGATAFERNQVVFRSEGRWGVAVMRPAGFVEVDWTDAPGS